MLSKKRRLTRSHFPIRSSQKAAFPFGTIVLSKAKESRAGVVVSKKIAAHAVKRNTLRRKIYTVLGQILPKLPSCLIVIYPNKAAISVPYSELEREIQKAIARLA